MPVKKPSKRKILLIKVLPAFGCGVFLFLLYAATTVNSIISRLFFPLFFGCFFTVLIAIIVKNNSKAIKAARMLSAIKDIDEKIDKINELQAKGFYKNTLGQYFNQISVAYYEKGDNEKALALIREAYAAETNTGLLFGRGVTISDVYRMNEVSYLIALGQIEEAERFIRLIDEGRFKQPNALNHILTSRAQIAVRKGNAVAAKELLREARALPIKMPQDVADNIRWNLLLIEAECDLLDGEIEIARSKLGDITAHCTYAPTIKRAEEIMNNSGCE